MPKSRDKIPESKLLKAINELEDSVAKGDALDEADPEGGLSTEGEPLSGAAPRGRGESTKKSRRAASRSSSSESDDSSSSSSSSGKARPSIASMMSAGGGKPKVKKSVASESSSESDDSSDDRSSDSGSDAEKSFRARAEDDETLRKGMIVNDFLEAFVDQHSRAMRNLAGSVAKSIKGMEARVVAALTEHIDATVAKGFAVQQGFNVRLAKAVAGIGNTIQSEVIDGMGGLIKSFGDLPAGQPRGKAVLSKGEINAPPWSGPGAGQDAGPGQDDEAVVAELAALRPEKISDWLFDKVSKSQVDANVMIAWEANRYDVETLSPQIRKALANDLIK